MLNRGTDAGRFYHQIRGSIIQKCDPYIWNFDRTSTRYKFYLRSHSFGLQARIIHTLPQVQNLNNILVGPIAENAFNPEKACKCCQSTSENEDEKHFLLVCSAYAVARQKLIQNLHCEMLASGLLYEWTKFSTADIDLQMYFLLGRRESSWKRPAFEIVDKHLRAFLLTAVDTRNRILSPTL